ncbi:MAG: GtrA family protein [Patescibacteria group bacterium]|nr:GtrA family protein [Patescibacteria group bacterium]
MRVLKFLATGIIGMSVNLTLFHALYVIGVPYLAGSALAFLAALVVGFLLQKYWTFEDRARERLRAQFALYAALALTNLAVNTLLVFLLVEYAGAYYLVAQAVGAGSVALASYFVYERFIFSGRALDG